LSAGESIGVDLGGTKMLIGVIGEDGRILHRRVARSAGLSGAEVMALLHAELEIALGERPDVGAIGLGIPCTIDRRRGVCVSAANLPLRDVPVRRIVQERFGLPVALDNDANTAVIAEHRSGVAKGATNVVMLTIGTGIGGGLILNGLPFHGSTGAGAEMGHVVVDIDGPRCQANCPNRGCIEAIASGTALTADAIEAARLAPDSGLGVALAEGRAIEGRLVTELAEHGDRVAIAVLATIGRRIGVALSGLANTFDPDVIVIGGGVIAAGEHLLAPARAELRARALTPQNETPVEAAAYGADAGMIGAAILAQDEFALATEAGV
jgi:glucokinase